MTQRIGHHGILLVDTDVTFRDELSIALERFDVTITWRARVLGLFEAIAETQPLALVLSADLPGGDPISLLRSIKSQDRWTDLAIYLVGDALPRETILRAYVEGADAVIHRESAVAEIAARALRRSNVIRAERSAAARRTADTALALCEMPDLIVPPETEVVAPITLAPAIPAGPRPDPVVIPITPTPLAPIGVSPPAAPAVAEPPTLPAEAPHARPATPVVVPDVIIVEDDPSLLEMLRYALTNRGYQTLSFSNGLDALRAMREMDTAGRQPVVLLDVDLPGIDGFRILHELGGSRPGTFQVILCTVHNSEATQVLGIQSGALDYLVKPLRMPIVLAKVERLVGQGSFSAAAQG